MVAKILRPDFVSEVVHLVRPGEWDALCGIAKPVMVAEAEDRVPVLKAGQQVCPGCRRQFQ